MSLKEKRPAAGSGLGVDSSQPDTGAARSDDHPRRDRDGPKVLSFSFERAYKSSPGGGCKSCLFVT